MPPNYRQQQGKALTLPERKGAFVLAGVILACAIGVGGWEASHSLGASHSQKCVSVVLGSSTGGGQVGACGAHALDWCRTESSAPAPVGPEVKLACRRAGYLGAAGPG